MCTYTKVSSGPNSSSLTRAQAHAVSPSRLAAFKKEIRKFTKTQIPDLRSISIKDPDPGPKHPVPGFQTKIMVSQKKNEVSQPRSRPLLSMFLVSESHILDGWKCLDVWIDEQPDSPYVLQDFVSFGASALLLS